MALEYLPIMAQSSAPKPPRVLVAPSKPVVVHGEEASEPVTRRAFDERGFATQPSGTLCAGRRPKLSAHSVRFQAKRDCDRSPLAHWSGATAES